MFSDAERKTSKKLEFLSEVCVCNVYVLIFDDVRAIKTLKYKRMVGYMVFGWENFGNKMTNEMLRQFPSTALLPPACCPLSATTH